jgi:hypothetical protein
MEYIGCWRPLVSATLPAPRGCTGRQVPKLSGSSLHPSHGTRRMQTLSQAQTFGVAVPVMEAAATGLVPGGQVGLNW